jgi:hypothetical protein
LLLAMVLSTTVLAALWSLLNIYTTLFDTAGVETEQAQLARTMLVMIETDLINVVPEAEPHKTSSTANGETSITTDSSATGDVTTATSMSANQTAAASNNTADAETTDDVDSLTTSIPGDAGSFSSDDGRGTASGTPEYATFAQPSLLGTSDTLWLVVYRYRDTSDLLNPQPFVTADTTFQPAVELSAVEYTLTYRDAVDTMGTVTATPSMPFETLDGAESSRPSETSSADGLDDWQGIVNADMETAAAQLGLIDREVVDASRGIERREAVWPVSPLVSSLPSESFDRTSLDESSGDGEAVPFRREFKPPSRLANIHGLASGTPSTTVVRDASPAEQVEFKSLLTPEVVRVRFRYHDGNAWRSQWDSRAQGALPRAVEIILAVLPTDDVAVQRDLREFEESQSGGESPWPVYRHVVTLPQAVQRGAHQHEAPNVEITPSQSDAGQTISSAAAGANE